MISIGDVEVSSTDASSLLVSPGSSMLVMNVGDRKYEFDGETAATALLWSEAIASHF